MSLANSLNYQGEETPGSAPNQSVTNSWNLSEARDQSQTRSWSGNIQLGHGRLSLSDDDRVSRKKDTTKKTTMGSPLRYDFSEPNLFKSGDIASSSRDTRQRTFNTFRTGIPSSESDDEDEEDENMITHTSHASASNNTGPLIVDSNGERKSDSDNDSVMFQNGRYLEEGYGPQLDHHTNTDYPKPSRSTKTSLLKKNNPKSYERKVTYSYYNNYDEDDEDSDDSMTFSQWPNFPDINTNSPIQSQLHHDQSIYASRHQYRQSPLDINPLSQSITDFSYKKHIPIIPNPELTTDPLHFLTQQIVKFENKLQDLLQEQQFVLKSGIPSKQYGSIYKIRKLILINFEKLKEMHKAKSEIYYKDKKSSSIFLKNFNKIENKKKKLINVINNINNIEINEGKKLTYLKIEKTKVNDEILILESRLQQLRSKDNILQIEIDQTQSVLDSKSSSYLESISQLEKTEINLSKQWLRENGDGYSKISDDDLNISQQFLLHHDDDDQDNEQKIAPKQMDLLGIADSILSTKDKLSSLFTPRKVSGDHESIPNRSSLIDVTSIIEMIGLQTKALEDQVAAEEKKMEEYENSSVIYSDVCRAVNEMETSLHHLAISKKLNKNPPDKILESSLSVLQSRLDTVENFGWNTATLAVKNETAAVQSGLELIKGPLAVENSNEFLTDNNDKSRTDKDILNHGRKVKKNE